MGFSVIPAFRCALGLIELGGGLVALFVGVIGDLGGVGGCLVAEVGVLDTVSPSKQLIDKPTLMESTLSICFFLPVR